MWLLYSFIVVEVGYGIFQKDLGRYSRTSYFPLFVEVINRLRLPSSTCFISYLEWLVFNKFSISWNPTIRFASTHLKMKGNTLIYLMTKSKHDQTMESPPSSVKLMMFENCTIYKMFVLHYFRPNCSNFR